MTTKTSTAGFEYKLMLTNMATNPDLVRKIQRLRFKVFNLELGEGLQSSWATGSDADPFDDVVDHLMVTAHGNGADGEIIATYRLQSGNHALQHRGYYMDGEFNTSALEPFRKQIIELGRLCIDINHRDGTALMKLLNGVTRYAWDHGGRYIMGCSSLALFEKKTGRDQTPDAAAIYEKYRNKLPPEGFRVTPVPHMVCPLDKQTHPTPDLPPLIRLYMLMGARFCGPPCLDREFKTLDFPTCVDLAEAVLTPAKRFFNGNVAVEQC